MNSKDLANKITLFFERYDMLGGATVEEMYDATYRALEGKDEEDIKIIKDYFKDIRWANKKAQEIFEELEVYFN